MVRISLAGMVADAEAVALELVRLTELERSAYHDVKCADPYAKETFERIHEGTRVDRDRCFARLANDCDRLWDEGVTCVSRSIMREAVRRCDVVQALALNALVRGFHPMEERGPSDAWGQVSGETVWEAQGEIPHVPGV